MFRGNVRQDIVLDDVTPEPNLSAGLQYLNGSYTSYCNRRHRRSSHLFQGRFKGHLIEEKGYFLEVSRYIHLKPVRAKIVTSPEQYRSRVESGNQRLQRTAKKPKRSLL